MIVIVGHGPSVNSGKGAVIDSMTVVRLKDGTQQRRETPATDWGTRTDYLCARSLIYRLDRTPFWLYPDPVTPAMQSSTLSIASAERWQRYYATFAPRHQKPSTGLCAVFCAVEFLDAKEIALIGFDRMLNPADKKSGKWHAMPSNHLWGHDQRAENAALHGLGIRIVDLSKEP